MEMNQLTNYSLWFHSTAMWFDRTLQNHVTTNQL